MDYEFSLDAELARVNEDINAIFRIVRRPIIDARRFALSRAGDDECAQREILKRVQMADQEDEERNARLLHEIVAMLRWYRK